MAAKPFRSMYLDMCPQALVEVWGLNPRLSVPHAASTARYTTRPLRLGDVRKFGYNDHGLSKRNFLHTTHANGTQFIWNSSVTNFIYCQSLHLLLFCDNLRFYIQELDQMILMSVIGACFEHYLFSAITFYVIRPNKISVITPPPIPIKGLCPKCTTLYC